MTPTQEELKQYYKDRSKTSLDIVNKFKECDKELNVKLDKDTHNMIPTKEDRLIKWDRLCNTIGLSQFDRAEEYAKWLQIETIKYCAEGLSINREVVKNDIQFINRSSRVIEETTIHYSINKQHMFNLIDEINGK